MQSPFSAAGKWDPSRICNCYRRLQTLLKNLDKIGPCIPSFHSLSTWTSKLTPFFLNRLEAVAAVSTLRCHLSALASSSDNINGTDTSQRIQQSPLQHSDCYSEILLSKYRENCSRLQHDLLDTKAKLAASESHVQDLQVELVEIAFLTSS